MNYITSQQHNVIYMRGKISVLNNQHQMVPVHEGQNLNCKAIPTELNILV